MKQDAFWHVMLVDRDAAKGVVVGHTGEEYFLAGGDGLGIREGLGEVRLRCVRCIS